MSDYSNQRKASSSMSAKADSFNRTKPEPGKQTLVEGISGRIRRKDEGNRSTQSPSSSAETKLSAASNSSGAKLPSAVRSDFEQSLGLDLGGVRVHTGSRSASAAKAVGAKAYTVGSDIHFGAGRFDLSSPGGMHLLAHEVAHTAQQAGASSVRQHKLEVSQAGDASELEADRAADAMVRGGRATVSPVSRTVISRESLEFEDDELLSLPSSQMREDGKKAAKELRQQPASRSEGATTSVDVGHAEEIVGWIESERGSLGALQGREAALNTEGQDATGRWKAADRFVPYVEGANAISHNDSAKKKLRSFSKAASKQDFSHAFFAPVYKQLGEDFVKLTATVNVITSQNLTVVGEGAKEDVVTAKNTNPLLADSIDKLKGAISGLRSFTSHAKSGVTATATSATTTFAALSTATDKLKLPPPELTDSAEQAKAKAQVGAVNADLAAAKAGIGTIKTVVKSAITIATGGAGAAAIPDVDRLLKGMGAKAKDLTARNPELAAVKAGAAIPAAAQSGIESQLASWITNYNLRIASASGKAENLKKRDDDNYAALQVEGVKNHQVQLVQQIAQFALLMKQVEEKKAMVENAAKRVQEQAMKEGKNGTNIGAAAQALASVSSFVTQADTAEALGTKEKEHGDEAKAKMKETAGDYHIERQQNELGGSDKLAETMPLNGEEAHYFKCKVEGDADRRGKYDLSGYKVTRGKIIFVINDDDKDKRSRVMGDRTDTQLSQITKWKGEAQAFEAKLEATLGTGKSSLK